jgi:hypothetical protein
MSRIRAHIDNPNHGFRIQFLKGFIDQLSILNVHKNIDRDLCFPGNQSKHIKITQVSSYQHGPLALIKEALHMPPAVIDHIKRVSSARPQSKSIQDDLREGV